MGLAGERRKQSRFNLPGIVKAFLAGLAVNAAVHDKSAEEKSEFFGNLFIPIFFVATGFLID
jgi:Kef-type K+ transport system membrane component KefB